MNCHCCGASQYTPEQRYMNDIDFRRLVDLMQSFLGKSQFTPTELREAAILAATRHSITSPNPVISFFMTTEDIPK